MPCESKDAEEEECKGGSKAECKYEALDDDLISDMSNGDAQMRRLVRHRLNAQQEEADALYCKRLLREERFAKGLPYLDRELVDPHTQQNPLVTTRGISHCRYKRVSAVCLGYCRRPPTILFYWIGSAYE